MIIRKVKSDTNDYLAKVTSYTYESFKCSLYKTFWMFPIKVHEKIFLRRSSNNSASEMIEATIFDYETGSLTE